MAFSAPRRPSAGARALSCSNTLEKSLRPRDGVRSSVESTPFRPIQSAGEIGLPLAKRVPVPQFPARPEPYPRGGSSSSPSTTRALLCPARGAHRRSASGYQFFAAQRHVVEDDVVRQRVHIRLDGSFRYGLHSRQRGRTARSRPRMGSRIEEPSSRPASPDLGAEGILKLGKQDAARFYGRARCRLSFLFTKSSDAAII